jgi:hypothetical protein
VYNGTNNVTQDEHGSGDVITSAVYARKCINASVCFNCVNVYVIDMHVYGDTYTTNMYKSLIEINVYVRSLNS